MNACKAHLTSGLTGDVILQTIISYQTQFKCCQWSKENDINEENPPESFQLGDIVWAHVPGNPWWPALIYGKELMNLF